VSEMPIKVRGVRKRYPRFTLQDIDLDVRAGRVLGLIGPNGAGKSTLLRVLMGLVRADSGEVAILGRPMPAEERWIKARVGFVSEDMALYGAKSLRWHMDLVASVHEGWDARRAAELLQRLDLDPNQKARGMSRGQQVKALLLLAVVRLRQDRALVPAHSPMLLFSDRRPWSQQERSGLPTASPRDGCA